MADACSQVLGHLLPSIAAYQQGVLSDTTQFRHLHRPRPHNPTDNYSLDDDGFARVDALLAPWLATFGISRLLPLFKCMSHMRDIAFLHAVYQGRLDVVRYLDDAFGIHSFCYNALDIAATRGHLDVLEYLHDRDYVGCTKVAMGGAALHGHVHVLAFLHRKRHEGCFRGALDGAAQRGLHDVVRWLVEHEADDITALSSGFAAESGNVELYRYVASLDDGADEDALAEDMAARLASDLAKASTNGHHDLAIYLHETCHAQWSPIAFTGAAGGGHLTLLQHFAVVAPDVVGEDMAIAHAAGNGHLEVVQYLLEHFHGRLLADIAVEYAARNGHLAILELLHSHGVEGNPSKAFDGAVKHGHLAVLQWLVARATVEIKVPQMYSIEEAAAGGHLDVVQYVLDDCFQTMEVCLDDAAANGHVHVLDGLLGHARATYTYRALDLAATNGHMETMTWLHEHGHRATKAAMDGAAGNGHLAIVRFLHERRVEGCSTEAIDRAAKKGYVHVIDFVWTHRAGQCTHRAVENAVACGSLDTVEYLHARGKRGGAILMDTAAANGDLAMVAFLHANSPAGCSTAALDRAAHGGHLEVVKFLHAHRPEGGTFLALQFCLSVPVLEFLHRVCRLAVSGVVLTHAASRGYLNVVQWAYEILRPMRTPGEPSTSAMDSAAEHGHLPVLKWLHATDTSYGCSTRAMDRAARQGHLEVVKWLYAYRKEGCSAAAYRDAAFRGDLRMISWLCMHYYRPAFEEEAVGVACGQIKAFLEARVRARHGGDVHVASS
ncbi:Aste57867_1634 [Aphanomyces stellatus]|uniref:Aste57867_1634 protein n=1 Tax=Aphanomyces stellatus TaxID=120398 RepID=A0A485K9W5_9STRA|nr:hypothetical protein As57867_001632 [Aphanomyces stellatus]VFT78847.1 Aste57867_1634 [Aphanomyces stellatus]